MPIHYLGHSLGRGMNGRVKIIHPNTFHPLTGVARLEDADEGKSINKFNRIAEPRNERVGNWFLALKRIGTARGSNPCVTQAPGWKIET
jgi:hypothetical protein